MARRHRFATVTIATIATALTLPAQRLEDVPVNAQLVVTLRDSSAQQQGNPAVRGSFLGADPSRLVLRVSPTGATQAVNRRDVAGVNWVQTTKMSGKRGALIGLGAGVALTTLASVIVANTASPCDCHIPPVAVPIVLGTMATAGFTVLGGLIGHDARERSVPIRVDP
jgi:hypothetical protein